MFDRVLNARLQMVEEHLLIKIKNTDTLNIYLFLHYRWVITAANCLSNRDQIHQTVVNIGEVSTKLFKLFGRTRWRPEK